MGLAKYALKTAFVAGKHKSCDANDNTRQLTLTYRHATPVGPPSTRSVPMLTFCLMVMCPQNSRATVKRAPRQGFVWAKDGRAGMTRGTNVGWGR
jgi:hypothetical protein